MLRTSSIDIVADRTERREVYKTVQEQAFPHIGLSDFLRKHNGEQLIDLMNVDVEGGEYGLLQALHGTFALRPAQLAAGKKSKHSA